MYVLDAPEELDQQAAALRESEAELTRQVVGLDQQAKELERVARLRQEHERAGDLAARDDDQPHRTAQQGTSRTTADSAPAPAAGGLGSSPSGGSPSPSPPFVSSGLYESVATIVLADVVDPSTIGTLARAQRSGDPKQRAAAAANTRDAVAARLAQLRKKRIEIQLRAEQLRRAR